MTLKDVCSTLILMVIGQLLFALNHLARSLLVPK